nr:DeoR family transcriptional regulator [Lentibacillus saliphilus]
MLPVERRHRIKELIQQFKSIKISDLSTQLGVSEMTVHRDIKPLIEDGTIIKTFGGISLASNDQTVYQNGCKLCHRTVEDRMAYRLILSNHQVETFCCAHCGILRHQQLSDEDVVQAICHDFLTGTTTSAYHAVYVMDTSLDMQCCKPQVLPFQWGSHAEKFVTGFGGDVYSFNEANERLISQMHTGADCCSTGEE